MLRSVLRLSCVGVALWGLAGCSGPAGDTPNLFLNEFTRQGTSISIESLTSGALRGRWVWQDAGKIYVASVTLQLQETLTDRAVLSSLTIDAWTEVASLTSGIAKSIVTPSPALPAESPTQNQFLLESILDRTVLMTLNLTDNTVLPDLSNALGYVTRDGSALFLVDSKSWLILEVANSFVEPTQTSISGIWSMIEITSPRTAQRPQLLKVGTKRGSVQKTFSSRIESDEVVFEGEYTVTELGAGIFGYRKAPSPNGTLDGLFVQSGQEKALLGVDFTEGLFRVGTL